MFHHFACCCNDEPAVGCHELRWAAAASPFPSHPTVDEEHPVDGGRYFGHKETYRTGMPFASHFRRCLYLLVLDRSTTPPSGAPGGSPPVTVNTSFLNSLDTYARGQVTIAGSTDSEFRLVGRFGEDLADSVERYAALEWRLTNQTFQTPSIIPTNSQYSLVAEGFILAVPAPSVPGASSGRTVTPAGTYSAGDCTASYETRNDSDGSLFEAQDGSMESLSTGACARDLWDWLDSPTGYHDPFIER